MNNNKVYYHRSVPYNLEAEAYTIGAVLIDNTIVNSLLGKLEAQDFYDPRHQAFYQAILNLHNNRHVINVLTLIEELKRLNYPDADKCEGYLLELVDSVPETASVELYINLVADTALERKLLSTMNLLSDDILNHKYELTDTLAQVENNIMSLIKMRQREKFITLGEAAKTSYEKITSVIGNSNKGITGLDTGYKQLNKATLGLQNGDLIILAARPAVGKSNYAINLAMQVARQNNANVAFFSLEMSVEQLMQRIYSISTHIDLSKIRSGDLGDDDVLLLGLNRDELQELNIHFDANPSSNIADIRAKCRQLKQQGKLDFVVVDYMQLATVSSNVKRGNRQEEVQIISRQLKTMAQELNIPVLALSQLSRDVTTREDKRPQLSDLRESGSIEQDADIVIFIYRRSDVEGEDPLEELAEKANEAAGTKRNSNAIEVVVSLAKNRQGPLMDIDYTFYGNICSFVENDNFRPLIPKRRRNKGMKKINN